MFWTPLVLVSRLIVTIDLPSMPRSTSASKGMTPQAALDAIVSGLREIPSPSGEDSAWPDVWEDIKDQLQHEASPYWPAYLDTVRQFTAGLVASLDAPMALELQGHLKCHSVQAVERKLLQRILNRAKREKIQYRPFEFAYFSYGLLDFTVYGRVLERTGLAQCYVRVFSPAAPFGEYGTIDCSQIDEVLTLEEFEHARAQLQPELRDQ